MRKRRRSQGDVELNMAAMLDMAFQLLCFFVLTFKPPPPEAQIDIRLPPAQADTSPKAIKDAGANENDKDPVKGLDTLHITVTPTGPAGTKAEYSISESSNQAEARRCKTLSDLKRELQDIFSKPTTFEQIIVHVWYKLSYDEAMSVVDVCSSIKKTDGQRITKLSLEEMNPEKIPKPPKKEGG